MYYNESSALINAVLETGIGRKFWRHVSDDEVVMVRHETEVHICRHSLEGGGGKTWYNMSLVDTVDGDGCEAWYTSLETACSQAIAITQGDINWLEPNPIRPVDIYPIEKWSFIIEDDGRHVKAINRDGSVVYPLKRVRLHKHNNWYELETLDGYRPSFALVHEGYFWELDCKLNPKLWKKGRFIG